MKGHYTKLGALVLVLALGYGWTQMGRDANTAHDNKLPEVALSQLHKLQLWNTSDPVDIVIVKAGDAGAMLKFTASTGELIGQLKKAGFSEYTAHPPRVLKAASAADEAAQIFLLHNAGQSLLALSVLPGTIRQEWELPLNPPWNPDDFAAAVYLEQDNGAIQTGQMLVKEIRSKNPVLEMKPPEPLTCAADQHQEGQVCVANVKACQLENAKEGEQAYKDGNWGPCETVIKCKTGEHVEGTLCVADVKKCSVGKKAGTQKFTDGKWEPCTVKPVAKKADGKKSKVSAKAKAPGRTPAKAKAGAKKPAPKTVKKTEKQ